MSLTLANAYAAAQSPQAVVLAHIVRDNVQEILGKALKQFGVSPGQFKEFFTGNPYETVSADGKNLGFVLEKGLGKLADNIFSGKRPQAGLEDGETPDKDSKDIQSNKWMAEIYLLNAYIREELGQAPGSTGVQAVQDGRIESPQEYINAINDLLAMVPGYDGHASVSARDGARGIITKNKDDLSPVQLHVEAIKHGLHGAAYHTYIGDRAWQEAKKHPDNSEEQLSWLRVVRSSMAGIENLKEAAHTR